MPHRMRMMSNETPTGEQVTRLLEAAGWSQAEAAFRLGVTPAAVSKWCSGDSPMRGVYWWFLRLDIASDIGPEHVGWPPPEYDELVKLLEGQE